MMSKQMVRVLKMVLDFVKKGYGSSYDFFYYDVERKILVATDRRFLFTIPFDLDVEKNSFVKLAGDELIIKEECNEYVDFSFLLNKDYEYVMDIEKIDNLLSLAAKHKMAISLDLYLKLFQTIFSVCGTTSVYRAKNNEMDLMKLETKLDGKTICFYFACMKVMD